MTLLTVTHEPNPQRRRALFALVVKLATQAPTPSNTPKNVG